MRTRYKKYEDWGLTKRQVLDAYEFLNSGLSELIKHDLISILNENLPAAVSEYVILALLEQKGYNTLEKMGLTYAKSDFYGYKRKGLWLVANYLGYIN